MIKSKTDTYLLLVNDRFRSQKTNELYRPFFSFFMTPDIDV